MKISLNWVLLVSMVAAPAFADGGVTCMSYSNNLPFIAQDSLELMAKTKAIQACQANGSTNNAECANQVQCQPTTPSWLQVECTTNSNSLPFDISGADELSVKALVIQSCEANGSTNNADCFSHAQCTTQQSNPWVEYSCLSESNSLLFTATGSDEGATKENVIQACQANGATNNADCLSKVQCEEISANFTPTVACTTNSSSLPFALEESKPRFDVMADVVRQCQANGATNNAECRNNVQCEISNQR